LQVDNIVEQAGALAMQAIALTKQRRAMDDHAAAL
jgi:hypothetical protein